MELDQKASLVSASSETDKQGKDETKAMKKVKGNEKEVDALENKSSWMWELLVCRILARFVFKDGREGCSQYSKAQIISLDNSTS